MDKNESNKTTYLPIEEHKKLGYQYLDRILERFRLVTREHPSEFILMDGHMRSVADSSLRIAEKLGLSEEDTIIAFVIGVLHDRGRLTQQFLVGANNDSVYKHAILSNVAAFGERPEIFEIFPGVKKHSEEWELIQWAILKHMVSKDSILEEEIAWFTPREKQFFDIITSADALSNLTAKFCDPRNTEHLMVVNKHKISELYDSKVPDHIFEKLVSGKTIDYRPDIWEYQGPGVADTAAAWYATWLGHGFNVSYWPAAEIVLEENAIQRISTIVEYTDPATRQRMSEIAQVVTAHLEKVAAQA